MGCDDTNHTARYTKFILNVMPLLNIGIAPLLHRYSPSAEVLCHMKVMSIYIYIHAAAKIEKTRIAIFLLLVCGKHVCFYVSSLARGDY